MSSHAKATPHSRPNNLVRDGDTDVAMQVEGSEDKLNFAVTAVDPLPQGWRRVPIKDMANSIQYGHTASAIQRESGPRFLRITDIQDGRVDWGAVPSCDIPLEDIPKYLLSPGDLVFARTGATTGKSFLIGDCPEAVFASYLIRVRVSTEVDSRYLSAFFQSPDYWRQIEGGKRGIGQPNVNGKILGEVQFPLAPLSEQRHIVAEIEKQFTRLEAGVTALKRVQANLKRYRAAVLKAACEGRLVPTEAELAKAENRKFETGEGLLARVLEERRRSWRGRGKYVEPQALDSAKLDSVPEGWAWATFEQIAERVTVGYVGSMKHEYVAHGVPFLRGQNVRENRFDPEGLLNISPEFHERISKSALRPSDLAVVRSGSVGVTCVIPDSLPEANCSDLVLIQRPLGFVPRYGAYYMNSLAKRHIAAGKVGVALIHFNTKSVAALAVPLPPIAEQARIVAEVERRLSVIEELEAAVSANLQRATRLRQSVLQKAFLGSLTRP